MKITIEVIDHAKQRYDTCGDWYYDIHGNLHIKVSRMADGRHEQLVALHELVEALLCDERGIDETDVTRFDLVYEAGRPFGDKSEPGDDHDAPYYKEHQVATGIERIMAAELGVDWNNYEDSINSLVWKT